MSTGSTERLIRHDDDFDDDDDDDQLNAPHQIVSSTRKPAALEANEQEVRSSVSNVNQPDSFDTGIQDLLHNDLKKFFFTSIPKEYLGFVQCHVKRQKEGLTKGFLPTFSLYFNGQNENDQTFLLYARKHITIGGHSEYFIGTNVDNPSDLNDENSIAKLRGINIADTEYVLYVRQDSSNNQNQSAAIVYDEHIFGSSEPRKFCVLLRNNGENDQSLNENETIIDEWRSGRSNNLIELKNAAPTFDEESKLYTLNFHEKRVVLPSHKNFQLITSDTDQGNHVAMEFGRSDENDYSLDYRYPLTAVQAFAIALSAFHRRFRT